MKHKLAVCLFVTTSLFSYAARAHQPVVFKDESAISKKPYHWTGFYAGLNVGAVRHTLSMTDNQATTFNATIDQVSNPQFTGGFQVGYRQQMDLANTSGVYGAEFSTNFSNATFNKQYGSSFSLYQLNAKNELKSVSLLQLIGGIAADRTLLFLAAGLSWTNIDGNVVNMASVPFFNSFNVGKKALGTALGAGMEFAMTDKISVRLKVDVITPNTYTTYDNIGDSFQISNNIVQGTLGVNYNFG